MVIFCFNCFILRFTEKKQTQSDVHAAAVEDFAKAITSFGESRLAAEDTPDTPVSAFKVLVYQQAQEMSPQNFQKILRTHHIILDGTVLVDIPCNRRGLLTLNGLKEIVNMEGMFPYLA